MNFKEARKRNVIIKITKCIIKNKILLEEVLSKEEIKEKYYLKQRDIKDYIDEIFSRCNGKFIIKDEYRKEIETYIEKHNKLKNQKKELINELGKKYSILKRCFSGFNFDDTTFKGELETAVILAEKLHWILMPIYSEQMIINRDIIPENNLLDYYYHFHSIEDLYFESINKGIDYRSVEGDINLNQEIKLNIYTSRWGDNDIYTIKRTIEGWNLSFSIYSGDFDKNGEGAFFESLEHDSVFFPKEAVKYALELLWNKADSTAMSIDELRYKFSQIAQWISSVEKVSRQYQPEWCNYF